MSPTMDEGECTVNLMGVSGRKALDACVKVIPVAEAWKKTCPRSNIFDELFEEPEYVDVKKTNHTTIDRDVPCDRTPDIQELYLDKHVDEHGAEELCGHIESEKAKRGIKKHVFELPAHDSISEHSEHEGLEATYRRLKETENSVDVLGAEGIGGYNGRKGVETNCDRGKELKHPVHGSGFILCDRLVLTSKYVIKPVVNDQGEGYEVYISSATIGMLPCKVLHVDERWDLAILLCPELIIEKNGICSLFPTNRSLSPGAQIFVFGYPLSFRGERALAAFGKVCSQEISSESSLVSLECPLDSGNYGSPVLCRISGQLKVVGVITQKSIQGIQTQDWRDDIKCVKEALQITASPRIQSYQTVPLLTSDTASKHLGIHRIYEILRARNPFCAIPGICLLDFLKTFVNKHKGKHEEVLSGIFAHISNCL